MKVREERSSAERLLVWHMRMVHPPIDVVAVARRMGVIVVEDEPELDARVVLEVEGPRAVVWVRAGQTEAQRRFAIAHALGHLLRQGSSAHCTLQGPDEHAASAFAADLLMPTWIVFRLPAREWSCARLAALFKVDPAVMQMRLETGASRRPADWGRVA